LALEAGFPVYWRLSLWLLLLRIEAGRREGLNWFVVAEGAMARGEYGRVVAESARGGLGAWSPRLDCGVHRRSVGRIESRGSGIHSNILVKIGEFRR
jgi:hypothetical protein